MTRPYVYRTTYSSVQDRYGYNSLSESDDSDTSDERTLVRVNNPVKTDLRLNNVNDIPTEVDHIKPKTGARIREDGHLHQGRTQYPGLFTSQVVLIITDADCLS